jgi:hypothetical protein
MGFTLISYNICFVLLFCTKVRYLIISRDTYFAILRTVAVLGSMLFVLVYKNGPTSPIGKSLVTSAIPYLTSSGTRRVLDIVL